MDNDINKNLPVVNIIKQTYGQMFGYVKQHLILSYIAMFPLFFIGIFYPLTLNPQQVNQTQILIYLIPLGLIYIIISIFYYRLYSLGTSSYLKIGINDLLKLFGKMTWYSLMLFSVQILALFTVGLLFGLMLSVIYSVAGLDPQSNYFSSVLAPLVIMVFLLLISLRVQPTFISIALQKEVLPMRSAYYYTRNNNWNLVIIGLASIFPAFLISQVIIYSINGVFNFDPLFNSILMYLLSPLSMYSFALLLAAGTEVYKFLVPANLKSGTFEAE